MSDVLGPYLITLPKGSLEASAKEYVLIIAGHFSKYPAHVLDEVMADHICKKPPVFWPSIAELQQAVDTRMYVINSLKGRIERGLGIETEPLGISKPEKRGAMRKAGSITANLLASRQTGP